MTSGSALSPFRLGQSTQVVSRHLGSRPAPLRGSEPVRLSSFNRLVVMAPDQDWREPVAGRLQELIRLPVGWDGYRAQPVDYLTADFALRMMESICPPDTPVPYLIPGTEADLQIEWHTAAGDIELHVRRPNSVHAWRQTDETGEDGEEFELTFDFRSILPWIKKLTEATADADTAAS